MNFTTQNFLWQLDGNMWVRTPWIARVQKLLISTLETDID